MKKKNLRIWLAVLAVCLLIPLCYVLMNRSTSREATAMEITAHAAYAVDWTQVPGWEADMTEKEFVLNLCSFREEKQIGSNVHQVYSSDVLAQYLYGCRELSDITLMNGTLYITYFGEGQDMVILAYADEGLTEMAVYDSDSDTMFHTIDGTSTLWSKFRKGFQWGK